MPEINQFEFQRPKLVEIRGYKRSQNWPVVYIISGSGRPRKAYIGETVGAYRRTREHINDSQKQDLEKIVIITDYDFNQSVTKDLESQLIQHIAGHDNYQVLNSNPGLVNADYYNREHYLQKFEEIWQRLQKLQVVDRDLEDIRNGNLFKYSPYKSLTGEQQEIVDSISRNFQQNPNSPQTYLVEGQPGTGKTVLAIYLLKHLVDEAKKDKRPIKAGLIAHNRRLRETLGDVIKGLAGFRKNMVMSPCDVVGDHYDLLIVDEAHLLNQPFNQARIGHFRKTSAKLGLDPARANQFDWIKQSSTSQILLYDADQAVRPANIQPQHIESTQISRHYLGRQYRIRGGREYIDYVSDILDDLKPQKQTFKDYDFKLCDRVEDLVSIVQAKETDKGLSRILAGWAWDWKMDSGPDDRPIAIGQNRLAFRNYNDKPPQTDDNGRLVDVASEVSSIHTIQGYDLNYAGVIIGPDLIYDPESKRTVSVKANYYDRMGKSSLADPSDLDTYIKRVYRVLLTRAIHGTYVYICDPELREYWRGFF